MDLGLKDRVAPITGAGSQVGFGKIDILVNNAGAITMTGTFTDQKEEDRDRDIDLNPGDVAQILNKLFRQQIMLSIQIL